MKIELSNGATFEVDDDAIDLEQLIKRSNACGSDEEYESKIDNMEGLTRGWRDILKLIIRCTFKIGDYIIKIGKILFNILLYLLLHFFNMIIGTLVGLFFGILCSSIPVLGVILGPMVTPVFALSGGVLGYLKDMTQKIDPDQERELRNEIVKSIRELFKK
jgi:hypothetical protein